MTYSNIDEGEEITFKYYSQSEEEVVEYTESLEFTFDMVVGNGFDPFGLSREFIIPPEFSLSAAYPNPFNPTTTISFGLAVDSKVSIQIYNLQGRVVETLASQFMQAGYHSVTWNANNYSSGVYFVKMATGDYVSTQKLLLVK